MKPISALLIITVTLLTACSAGQWVQTPVAKEYAFNVILEESSTHAKTPEQGHVRAEEVEPAVLVRLMEDLSYVDQTSTQGTETPNPVFQASEIDRLAPVLSEELAKTDAKRRLRFISYNQGQGMIFSVSRKTEGVMFIDPDGQLNIAFNVINAERHPSETTAVFANVAKVDPLKLKTSETPLLSPAYAKLHHHETGEPAPMWLVADLAMLSKTARTPTTEVRQGGEDGSPSSAAVFTSNSSPTQQSSPSRSTGDDHQAELKNKLRFLKELLEEGLISEKGYHGKQTELLGQID